MDTISELILSDKNLKAIPPEIRYFTQLEHLFLENNSISFIPEEISYLKNLKRLFLSGNQINEIPDSIAQLPKLFLLWLSCNRIRKIPDSLASAPRITTLILNDNQISIIPDSLGTLSTLNTLGLSNNIISKVPILLAKLDNLSWLELSHNKISILPYSLISMAKLETLNINSNPLLLFSDRGPGNAIERSIKETFVQEFTNIKAYQCQSPLAKLCKAMILQVAIDDELQKKIDTLKVEDQNLIFEMIYVEAGSPQTNDAQWGQHDAFDDMQIFQRAIRKAISLKFDRLSQDDKNKAYGRGLRYCQSGYARRAVGRKSCI